GHVISDIAGGLPWVPLDERLARAQQRATYDGAALLEALRHCQWNSQPPPAWLVDGFLAMTIEFVNALTPPSVAPPRTPQPPSPFAAWAREYRKAAQDFLVADHVQANRDIYGM